MSGSPFGILEMWSADKAADTQAEASMDSGRLQYKATIEAAQLYTDAQKEAARLQLQAQQEATGELRRQYDVMSSQLEPYVTAGKQGLDKFSTMVNAGPGDYTKSPGYDFRLQQGLDAMQKSASAKGVLNNPQTMKALNEYGQNYATADYDNFLNRYYQSLVPYQTLANIGQSSAARTGTAGMDMATGIANLSSATSGNIANQLMASAGTQGGYLTSGSNALANASNAAANARASGYINMANAGGQQFNNAGQVGGYLSSMYSGGGGGYSIPAGYDVGGAAQTGYWYL